jgi:type VI secretion system secreted protein Hcp
MATDIFAKLGDIKGESVDATHKDEIEVLSFSWGASKTGSIGPGTGGIAGGVTFKDLSIVHTIDKASPALLQACATGTVLKDGTISVRRTAVAGKAQQDYLVVKMNDIIITSVTESSSADQPSETVSLAFSKIDYEYLPLKEAAVAFKYDLKTNKTF